MMKIFGIGLERTGTTSLAAAMRVLGFTTRHFPRSTNEIDEADFSNDITVSCRFRELDAAYPGSKFILTVREIEAWLDSCERWYGFLLENRVMDFTGMAAALYLYGIEVFDREIWREGYISHRIAVLAYFARRPDDLLVLDICGGQGWERLLPFLAPVMPEFPRENIFPRENVFQAG
jgi:hypothetical protein